MKNRFGAVALSLGVALFLGLIIWQGAAPVAATLALAGWGLLGLAAFHVLPLVLDAAAIDALRAGLQAAAPRRAWLTSLQARWIGESVNSLLPAGQLGGPVAMVRQLTEPGMSGADAAAVVTVSTTMQTLAQLAFALIGAALCVTRLAHAATEGILLTLAAVLVIFVLLLGGLYITQRRGMFGRLARFLPKFGGKRDWSAWLSRAEAMDASVRALYAAPWPVFYSFLLSLLGWLVGTGEVWLALRCIDHPVGWVDALLLESLGQAIRGAAFAIPASLGVQEGGYLLLAPLVGLPPHAALALSLAKRAREILLGLPGLICLHFVERHRGRRLTRAMKPSTAERGG
ncbi:MAG: lysylphosphatidylglycerol synthase domain-containing protein [Janthinobacterium lividum]